MVRKKAKTEEKVKVRVKEFVARIGITQVELAEKIGVKKETVYTRAVAESIDYIESNLHMPLRIDEVAEHVNLSAGYLSVLFRRETGTAFSDYVLRRRIDTAQNMLRYSDYTSTEISEILAFSSQSYFIRCFRKQAGMTPSEYRRRYYAKGIRAAGRNAAAEEKDRDWRDGGI